MFCQHVQQGPRLFVCAVCGHPAITDKQPGNRICGGPLVEKQSPPGLLRKARNFAGAMVSAAADGFHRAPQSVIDARLAVCGECDRRDPANNSCLECGCNLAYKPTMLAWDCPLKKWPKADQLSTLKQASTSATQIPTQNGSPLNGMARIST